MTGEKLNQAEEVRIAINSDKRDVDVDLKHDTEVVYKPTTMDNAGKANLNFQILKPESPVKQNDPLFLYQAAFLANLLAFAAGSGFSWSSPVLPKLDGPDSPLNSPVDPSQKSIIAAILCVGAALGPFIFGYLADKIGRKYTLILTSLPMVVGLSLLAFTGNVLVYYAARLVFGLGSGGVFTVLTMYTGEITADHNRGKFSCYLGIFVASGVLFPFAVGTFFSVRIFCLLCLTPLVIFLSLFSFVGPESPPYLIKTGKFDEAQRTLMGLRNISLDLARKEVAESQVVMERHKHEKSGFAELFRSRGTKRALMVSVGLLMLQQFSGINAVLGFMENIFAATGSSIPPQVATTLIGSIQVLTVFVTSSVIDKLGRKVLLLASTLGSAVSIILLGLYFFLHRQRFESLACFWWLPIACLLIYIVSFNLGLGPVPWTILSEVFPDNVKSSAAALASSTCFSVSFVVTMAFPLISEMLGMAESFWLFGVCCIMGVVFIWTVVPETRGKNVQQIQEMLSK